MDKPDPLMEDVELFDPTLTFDGILIDLFRNTDAPEVAIGRVFRLVLQKLWYSNKLAHPTDDITPRLAALHLAAGGMPLGVHNTEQDFSEHIDNWERRTKDCTLRIYEICGDHPKLLRRVCKYLEDKIRQSQPSFSFESSKTLTELVICVYATQADKLATQDEAAKLEYDPKTQFQIEIVTFLKFYGGEPSKIRTFNLPETIDWNVFQQYLTTATANWQSTMLGYPDGYNLSDGWQYQIVKAGVVLPTWYPFLGEEQFHKLMKGVISQPDRKDEVPRFIHTKQRLVSKTLKDKRRRIRDDPDYGFGGIYDRTDESGYAYIALPPGFMPAFYSKAEDASKAGVKLEKIKAADAAKTKQEAVAAERFQRKKQRSRIKRREKLDNQIELKYGARPTSSKTPEEGEEQNDDGNGSDDGLFVAPSRNRVATTIRAPTKQPALRLFPKPLPRRSLKSHQAVSLSSRDQAALSLALKPKFSYEKYRSLEDEVYDDDDSEDE